MLCVQTLCKAFILLDIIIVVIDLTIIEWCNNKFIIIQSTVMAKNL